MGLETATVIALAQLGASLVATTALTFLKKNPKQDLRDFTNENDGENAPIQKGYGPRAVVQPHPIWKKRNDDHDSEGVPRYRAHVMLALSEAPTDGAAVELHRLTHGDKTIYSTQPDLDITTDLVSCERIEYYEQDENGDPFLSAVSMKITSPSGGPNLKAYKSGLKVVLSGWDEAGNNGTFLVALSTKDNDSGETTMTCVNIDCVTEAAGEDVRIFMALPNFSRRDLRSLTFFNGNALQVPSTFIEQYEGTGNVEANHGLVGLLVDKLFLNDSGGTIQSWRAVLGQTSDDAPLADVVREICLEEPSVDASMIDVSGVSGTVRGFTSDPDQSPNDKLEALAAAYLIMSQERDGVRYFFTRDNATEVEIPYGDLSVHDIGGVPEEFPFVVRTPDDYEVPSRIVVTFWNEDRNFAEDSVSEHKSDTGNSNVDTLALPCVFTRDQAAAIAARIKWIAKANERRVLFTLGIKHARIQANDVAVITDDLGRVWKILLDVVDAAPDNRIRCEGLLEEAGVLEAFPRSSDPSLDETRDVYVPPFLQFEVLDLAPLDNANLNRPGFRWASAATDPTADFAQSVLYISTDGVNFVPRDYANHEVTMGRTVTALGTGTHGLWDRNTVLRVAVVQGELLSTTEEEMVTIGANQCVVGGEVCAFRDATLVSTSGDIRVYDLGGAWLRGMRNTAAFTDTHSAQERFVMIDQQLLPFYELNVPPQTMLYFKCVPVEGDPDDFPATAHTFRAENVLTWGPWRIRGDRRASQRAVEGTWVLWDRRTRAIGPFFGSRPLVEPEELYQVRVLDSTGGSGSVIWEREVPGTSRAFISEVIQTGLGLTYGNLFGVRIRQWSHAANTWGHESEGVV